MVFQQPVRKQDVVFYIFYIGYIILFEVLWPILLFKNKKSIKDRIIADENAELDSSSRALFGRLQKTFGTFISSIIYVTLLGCMLASSAGRAKAYNQEEYYQIVNEPNIAVVRIYSDMIIGVSFDQKDKSVTKKILIQRFSERSKLELVMSKIGPLKFVQ
jgi:hypothetical protein